ncbi:DUF4342 domain-containing protein [Natroniella sulfidigena]|uniref:DUF4342 domain-containing protein n=1 Tax=Natroniella sulfidigena TaxID=723921 RepID=UPI00200B8E5B|nr:DUF4342 domain-containing protein [Natroniella sulfidigena]MCK8815937.1 DUF4342 domain-containing protein [Natroniella sulfidigena]
MEDLEKLDVIKERTGASYEEAITALKNSNGDVLKAIIQLEEENSKQNNTDNSSNNNYNYYKEEFQVQGQKILGKVKELIKEGNITRIKVKKGEKVLVDIPATAGVIGTVLYPSLLLLGSVTALATECTIEVERVKKE